MTFDAVVFDHDGTLVDTVRPDYEACSLLFAELGLALSKERWARAACGHIEAYDDLLATASDALGGRPTAHELQGRLQHYWDQTLTEDNVGLMPGVRPLLAALQQAGYRLAVASAASRKWVKRWLAFYDIENYFEVVVGREQVAKSKPEPDIYQLAARRLGVDPAQCLAIEDSPVGAEAAARAGMTVAAVPTELARFLAYRHAYVVLESLVDVDVPWVAELYASRRRPRSSAPELSTPGPR